MGERTVSKDPTLARELKALQEEVASLRRERLSQPSDHPAVEPEAPAPHVDDGEPTRLADLREFIDEITRFLGDAEKNASAHPMVAMVGALMAGIVIGRLLGRR
jgi:hypothetical protein